MTTRKLSQMTEDDLKDAVRDAVRAEFFAAGLRVDDSRDQEEARADFMFLRTLRRSFVGVSTKIGMTIILAFVGGIGWLIMQGLSFWKAN